MHIVSSVLFIVGALILLVTGLSSLLHDLMEGATHDAPHVDEATLWAERHQVAASQRVVQGPVAWNGRPEQQRL
jgi:hypothetical protein